MCCRPFFDEREEERKGGGTVPEEGESIEVEVCVAEEEEMKRRETRGEMVTWSEQDWTQPTMANSPRMRERGDDAGELFRWLEVHAWKEERLKVETRTQRGTKRNGSKKRETAGGIRKKSRGPAKAAGE